MFVMEQQMAINNLFYFMYVDSRILRVHYSFFLFTSRGSNNALGEYSCPGVVVKKAV